MAYNNNTLKSSYTWKSEYCLPYETSWARISKFCFLNGVSKSYITQNKLLRKNVCIDLVKPIHYNFPQAKENATPVMFKICPKCMIYGYQSYLHLINGLNVCFLHKCQLISIPLADVGSFQDIYQLMNIKIEDIIQNATLSSMLNTYILHRERKAPLEIRYIWPKYENGEERRCYKSTMRIFQKKYLLQNNIDIDGCSCIQSLAVDKIDAMNELLKSEILDNYAKYCLQNDIFFPDFTDVENILLHITNICIPKRTFPRHYISNDTLGWCLMKIMWDIIERRFTTYNNWIKAVRITNSRFSNDMTFKDIDKYAIVLAYQAITTNLSCENIMRLHSKNWKRNGFTCKFSINVYDELGYYNEPYHIYGSIEKQKAAQYTVFPIVKDLFKDLINQAYHMLKNGVIELSPNHIEGLTTDIWNVPQYVVLYYNDKTEIYRCESD